MKKTIKLAVVAALALGATSAFATNGSTLIGVGAKARGMGGVGIGMSHGAESALVNPAMITSVKSTEVSFGGTVFMPNVENTNSLGGPSSTTKSAADLSVIPSISIAKKINDNFYLGIGMWGTAGVGADYRQADSVTEAGTQMQMVTNLQLMQFGVPLAYKTEGLSLAFTPLLQYGALDINYEHPDETIYSAGTGQDLQFGFNLGLAYEVDAFTIGAVYKSQIDMQYKDVMSNTISAFSTTGAYENEKLSSPEEMGVGVSYNINEHTIALDYKHIAWSKAKGYEDFEWEDQNVIALGYEYAADGWAARVGYNYADSPIKEQTNATPNSAGLNGTTVNTFNLLGFPAIVTSHVTTGGTYTINKQLCVDLAVVYALEAKNSYRNFAAQDITTKHSQTSVSAQINYAF